MSPLFELPLTFTDRCSSFLLNSDHASSIACSCMYPYGIDVFINNLALEAIFSTSWILSEQL